MNVHSIRNNSELVSDQIKGNIDVLMISETKTNDSFQLRNYLVDGFSSLYRLGQDSVRGGILLYVRKDVPSNLLSTETKPNERSYVELNLQNSKWLINCSNNPHKNVIGNHI